MYTKTTGIKVLCTHLLCENTSNVRHVGHDALPLAYGTHCHKKIMQWFENTVLSDFLCLALKQNLDGHDREVETVVLQWVMMQDTTAVDYDERNSSDDRKNAADVAGTVEK